MIETGILWIALFIVCVLFFLQRDLCRRFKANFTDDISSGEESSSVPSDTNEIVEKSNSTLSPVIWNASANRTVTVDANNEQTIEETVSVQKSDSTDEGDFEVISKEQLNNVMADTQNSDANNDGGERRFSISEEGISEANDKFPQQMTTKNSNWNTMELGEKRKRLR